MDEAMRARGSWMGRAVPLVLLGGALSFSFSTAERHGRAMSSGSLPPAMLAGCQSNGSPAPAAVATVSVEKTSGSSAPPPPSEASRVSVTPEGELKTVGQVSFEIRPLGGPGTMGPTELSPKSTPALTEIRDYLLAHPDAGPLRIECAVNPLMMSSNPNADWPAGLGEQIARWFVANGVECRRLEVLGWLDKANRASPGERVSFYIGANARRAPLGARRDPCSAR
jgi:hypothetical protein